jgi:PIN domain nuclease of toxin-antitoxin system
LKVLLDTHAFLWLMVDDPRLSSAAKSAFSDVNNEIYLSMASAWEMAIKSSIQKLQLPLPVKDYVLTRTQAHNINLLNITLEHIDVVETLPLHHRDPFDRLIIAQGIFESNAFSPMILLLVSILFKDCGKGAWPVRSSQERTPQYTFPY